MAKTPSTNQITMLGGHNIGPTPTKSKNPPAADQKPEPPEKTEDQEEKTPEPEQEPTE